MADDPTLSASETILATPPRTNGLQHGTPDASQLPTAPQRTLPATLSPEALGLSADTQRRIAAELGKLSDDDRAKIERVVADLEASRPQVAVTQPNVASTTTTGPTEAPAPPPPSPVDPHAQEPHLLRMPDMPYLWSTEAMERDAYVFQGQRRYKPLYGLLLGSKEKEKADPLYMFLLERELVVADAFNRFVRLPPGRRVVVRGGHGLRAQLERFKDLKACPMSRLWPTGYQTHANGDREMNILALFEPDPNDPTRAATVSYESALGREARAQGRTP